jgi:hypothetical protein
MTRDEAHAPVEGKNQAPMTAGPIALCPPRGYGTVKPLYGSSGRPIRCTPPEDGCEQGECAPSKREGVSQEFPWKLLPAKPEAGIDRGPE